MSRNKEKMMKQQWNIFKTSPQGRDFQTNHIQTIIEIFPERTRFRCLKQIYFGGGNHPDVQRDQLVRAQPLKGSFLQDP